MPPQESDVGPFVVKDCALVAIATGLTAQNLRELRDHLLAVPLSSVYYHFLGGRLRPVFEDPQYNNDFAIWCHYTVHDDILAERLAVIDPKDFPDSEDLRQEVVDIIDQRIDEIVRPTWVSHDRQFNFIRSQIVVFDARIRIDKPVDLVEAVPNMSLSSIFYHFIDARRRTPGAIDDFRTWLSGFGDAYEATCGALAGVDPYFVTLVELRAQLGELFQLFLGGESA